MEQKSQKKFLVLKIIALEPGSTNSYILEQDTCHWESICYQGTITFNVSLGDAYSKAASLTVIKNIVKVLS